MRVRRGWENCTLYKYPYPFTWFDSVKLRDRFVGTFIHWLCQLMATDYLRINFLLTLPAALSSQRMAVQGGLRMTMATIVRGYRYANFLSSSCRVPFIRQRYYIWAYHTSRS